MLKTGIYVDGENIRLCGGYGMRYDVLKKYVAMDDSVILRANSYVVEDLEQTDKDDDYRRKLYRYHDVLRSHGFKLIKKPVQRYVNSDGEVTVKANVDMDLGIDALLQSRHLDRVVLLSGDGDFCHLIHAMQNFGCRVEVIGFLNVAKRLKEAADFYLSGFMIPGLLPTSDNGEIIRGYPVNYWQDKGYGFFRHLQLNDEGLAEKEVFFHHSHFEDEISTDALTRPSNIFEFRLVPSTVKEGDLMATEIRHAHSHVVI